MTETETKIDLLYRMINSAADVLRLHQSIVDLHHRHIQRLLDLMAEQQRQTEALAHTVDELVLGR